MPNTELTSRRSTVKTEVADCLPNGFFNTLSTIDLSKINDPPEFDKIKDLLETLVVANIYATGDGTTPDDMDSHLKHISNLVVFTKKNDFLNSSKTISPDNKTKETLRNKFDNLSDSFSSFFATGGYRSNTDINGNIIPTILIFTSKKSTLAHELQHAADAILGTLEYSNIMDIILRLSTIIELPLVTLFILDTLANESNYSFGTSLPSTANSFALPAVIVNMLRTITYYSLPTEKRAFKIGKKVRKKLK